MDELAVTGSTGRLGGRVARRLAADGVPQRLIVRDPARAPDLPSSTVARAEYRDGAVSEAALAGVRTLFMVSGSESPDRVQEHRTFVDAAKAAGVGHVVYVSFFAAASDAIFTLARDHWATEQHIREAGLDFAFLRDNLYADFLPLMAAADGVIRGPAAEGRVSAVALDDIADVACTVLRSPEDHVGRTYSLTGPQALTLTEAAEIMSEVTATPYSFHNETVAEAYASRADYGAPIGRWMRGCPRTRPSPAMRGRRSPMTCSACRAIPRRHWLGCCSVRRGAVDGSGLALSPTTRCADPSGQDSHRRPVVDRVADDRGHQSPAINLIPGAGAS